MVLNHIKNLKNALVAYVVCYGFMLPSFFTLLRHSVACRIWWMPGVYNAFSETSEWDCRQRHAETCGCPVPTPRKRFDLIHTSQSHLYFNANIFIGFPQRLSHTCLSMLIFLLDTNKRLNHTCLSMLTLLLDSHNPTITLVCYTRDKSSILKEIDLHS